MFIDTSTFTKTEGYARTKNSVEALMRKVVVRARAAGRSGTANA